MECAGPEARRRPSRPSLCSPGWLSGVRSRPPRTAALRAGHARLALSRSTRRPAPPSLLRDGDLRL